MGKYTINAKRDVNFVDQGNIHQYNTYVNNDLNQKHIDTLIIVKTKIEQLIDTINCSSTHDVMLKDQALNELSVQQQYIDNVINDTASTEEKSKIKQFFISLKQEPSSVLAMIANIKEYEELVEWITQKSNDLLPYF